MGEAGGESHTVVRVLDGEAGLHSLTQHLAMELADFNIRVNAVSPGVGLTASYGNFIEPSKIEGELQAFNAFHPIGRIGRPTDVASVIDFLCRTTRAGSQGRSGMWTAG